MQSIVKQPFNCVLVVATKYDKGVAQFVSNAITRKTKGRFLKIAVSEDDPVAELKAIKEQTGGAGDESKKVILIVQGTVGHTAIRYLCDDADKPLAERRVVWIHSLSVGLDPYRLFEIADVVAPVPITNGKCSQSRAMAEYVFSSVFYFNRKTWLMQQNKKEHKWEKFNIQELYGQRMAILGYGDIGEATGRLAAAFAMKVEAVKRSLPAGVEKSPYVDAHGVKVFTEEVGRDRQHLGAEEAAQHQKAFDAERNRIIAEADYVVNVLPGTPETMQLFDRHRFATMKRNAVYVNIGRGCTNNEDALVAALKDGVIRGAALDVFVEEPLPKTSPLWEVSDDKLQLTSHNGAQTTNQLPLLVDRFIDLCERWDRGENLEPENVNRTFWY